MDPAQKRNVLLLSPKEYGHPGFSNRAVTAANNVGVAMRGSWKIFSMALVLAHGVSAADHAGLQTAENTRPEAARTSPTSPTDGFAYQDLSDATRLRCTTQSGRTVVHVEKFQNYYWITVIQDRRWILLKDVPTGLMVQESFPATYIYRGRTSKAIYLTLGQTTQDENFERFSPVMGTVRYVKNGQTLEVEVGCQVLAVVRK
jgi:hypothetical protein